MSKIKIISRINNETLNIEGIKTNNNIIYKEKEIFVKIIVGENLKIIRENNEFKIELIFNKLNKTTGTYLLKEYNKILNLDIETKQLCIMDNLIEINYIINDNENINFKLEFEEI